MCITPIAFTYFRWERVKIVIFRLPEGGAGLKFFGILPEKYTVFPVEKLKTLFMLYVINIKGDWANGD